MVRLGQIIAKLYSVILMINYPISSLGQ